MTLTELLGSGVGPVSVRPSSEGVTAVFDGHDVQCVAEGATVRLRLEARLLWVGQARAGELRLRLAEHALSRPELLTTDVADDGSTATLTLWVDADPMTPLTLAQAVRSVRRSLAEAEPQMTSLGAAIVRDRPAGLPTRTTSPLASPVSEQAAPPMFGEQTPQSEAAQQIDEPQVDDADALAPGADEPRWGYVQQPTEVRGLLDTEVVVGTLVPGQWYELRTTANGWTHVVSVDSTMEGWAAAALLHERS